MQQQRYATRPQIAAVDAVIGQFVVGVTSALGPYAGDAQVEWIADERDVEHAFHTAVVVISDIERGHRFVTIRRLCGGEIDDACRRVAAVEGALRPAQNL